MKIFTRGSSLLLTVSLLLLSLVAAPAFAGTAIVPHFYIGVDDGTYDYTMTEVFVTNVSEVAQHVQVEFKEVGGMAMANQPCYFRNGSPNDTLTTLNSVGSISADVQPGATMRVYLMGNTVSHMGHAKITGTIANSTIPASLTTGLIAYAWIHDMDMKKIGFIESRSVQVNGGLPF